MIGFFIGFYLLLMLMYILCSLLRIYFELQTPPLPLPFLRPAGSKRPKGRADGRGVPPGDVVLSSPPFKGRGRGGVSVFSCHSCDLCNDSLKR